MRIKLMALGSGIFDVTGSLRYTSSHAQTTSHDPFELSEVIPPADQLH
jgi:hypothetical protein